MKRQDLDKFGRVASAVTQTASPALSAAPHLIVMRDFECVRHLEEDFLIYPDMDHTSERVKKVSRELFGVDIDDLYAIADKEDGINDVDDSDLLDGQGSFVEYEEEGEESYLDKFACFQYRFDADEAETLLAVGLDFRDGRGHPLRCTRALSLIAEAVAKGALGRKPDPSKISDQAFEAKLKRDAEAYLRKKRAG
jgi:hypothetical protein